MLSPTAAASLSRRIQATPPELVHTLQQEHNSILSVATDARYIYSGSQSADIAVWDNASYELRTTLRGHTGSVLALEYAPDKRWLFSSSGAPSVWCTRTHAPLFVLNPYLDTDAGDLFSIAWSQLHQTLYFGCQNTSVQWYSFPDTDIALQAASGASTPTPGVRKAHKFFDSYPRFQRKPADVQAHNGAEEASSGVASPRMSLDVPPSNVVDSAHYGYVYCMALVPSPRDGSDDAPPLERDGVLLVTGSGDETVKVWKCTDAGPEYQHTFDCCHGAVLSIATRGDNVYSGCQDGYVKVWDLQTRTLVRTIIVQEGVDVLSLSVVHSDVYTFSANGCVKRFSDTFDCTASWCAHDGIVLSSIVSKKTTVEGDEYRLITGGNDAAIKVWTVVPPTADYQDSNAIEEHKARDGAYLILTLLHRADSFVSIPSVSSLPENREDCRQAAVWLSKCLQQLGATSKTLSTGDVQNPIVFAMFQGAQSDRRKPRILVYGHYDVISAPPEGWNSDPFRLTARNGFLYGRGVSDDKGPVLAIACAAADLLQQRKLGIDLLFLVEGEEETGSVGFRETVQKYKDLIGPVDAILVSNSSWIAPNVPSITYGLRGVVHCNIQISSDGEDAHSGVYGGAVEEPMQDMIQLLAALKDHNRQVLIPGFYDHVRPQDQKERELFEHIEEITQSSASHLKARWCEPSLTIHNVEGSGPRNSTVIPATVTAQVSIRIVPDQDLDVVAHSLCQHIQQSFATLGSLHKLSVSVEHTADWWLGDLEHPWFKALESAVRDEWHVEPMRVREGGTIPCVPFLEKEFDCPALHLPMGQSADQAHLPNEHLALSHLHHGKSVVERFLLAVGESGVQASSA
ncbi:Zn-dependent exopeptidase [Amylostereum chailletii]|nr:Zn-dependent exopeptidase [Amylostereum chailletii]